MLPTLIVGTITVLFLSAGYDTIAPATPVRVAPIVQKTATGVQSGSAIVQAAGWIEPEPFEIAVSALADGIVEEVLVLESESVVQGQVLVRLVDDDARLQLEQSEAAIALAEADLMSARAELAAAETDWENPVELEHATASSTAQFDEMRAKLAQIDAEIKADAAILKEAERAFQRVHELLREDNVGTQAEVDKEQARFEAQTAKVQAKQSERATVLAAIAGVEAKVRAAQENLRLRTQDRERLDKARAALAQAEAKLEVARIAREVKSLQLERMEIRSPVDGIVMRRLTSPGAKVVRMMDNPYSSHVVHLYDPERLQVRVDVALADAALVHLGQRAEMTVEAFPDTAFTGVVSRVTHEANIQKNTLEVQVAITEPRPGLRPEMLARVKFFPIPSTEGDGNRMALYAPRSAVMKDADTTLVLAVEDVRGERGVARRRSVETERQGNSDWIRIVSGVKLGDRLVLNPPADLRDGARVRMLSEVADKHTEQKNDTD